MHNIRWIMFGLLVPLTASAAELKTLPDNMFWADFVIATIVICALLTLSICILAAQPSKSTRNRRNKDGFGSDGYLGDFGSCGGGGGDGGGDGGGGD